jgi:thioredoxin reductase (NADPH)
MAQNIYDVVILGSGPAGLAAAIYTTRAGYNTALCQGPLIGGQLTSTTVVENFPGFPEGITGPELMEKIQAQAQKFGAEFITAAAQAVELKQRPFTIQLDNGHSVKASTLIIATGASARYLGLPHEAELIGRGVSACATCDGFFYHNKTVYVIGGGDTALEDATFLTKFAQEVFLVHRRDQLRASAAMQERAKKNPKIKFIWDTVVKELKYDQHGLNGLVLENVKTQQTSTVRTDGLFVAIGHTPNTKFLNGQLPCHEQGTIQTTNLVETSIPGVFAGGDVADPRFRQAITAAATGAMCGMAAAKFLQAHPLA